VRDSAAADGSPIHAGDIMGIQGDDILVVGSSVEQVTLDLIGKMLDEDEGDTLTILAGEDMGDDDFDALVEKIEDAYPDLDVDPHRGEQPLYPVIFSIE
jgi:dihydroxyacetone kinase-like predicted kinase